MFWSANYMSMRELNFLLKEENVTLAQILEADDILQECKADNSALIAFLTRPEILAELVTLITQEPPMDLELTSQYRHSNIACEVLTSQLSSLSHRLCMDVVQMNRLCDFVSREPPLNPLLASYFSRTVETLLKRSPKQDCYLHHIVCLRALDFFRARKDFLPNLLKHLSTSAIADTFKYFILCLEDPFNKIIMEWLDEHQFLENLIQIVCCNYEPEELQPTAVPMTTENQNNMEKGVNEVSEKADTNHKDSDDSKPSDLDEERVRRIRAVASANASALASELVGGAGEMWPASSWCSQELGARLRSEPLVRALLQGCFTSPPHMRDHALVNGCRLLRALMHSHSEDGSVSEEQRQNVERAVAPHLPLLHHALLQQPPDGWRVGAARVQIAALLAELVLSEVQDVHTAIQSLGTVGVLLDMFFSFPENNFLHAQVCTLVENIAKNLTQEDRYWQQLLVEGDLLTRLMDTFEKNEDRKEGPRAGLMGHTVALCRTLYWLPVHLLARPDVLPRWETFVETRLQPLVTRLDMPLGGEYPSATFYETGNVEFTSSYAENGLVLSETLGDGAHESEDREDFDEQMWEDNPTEVLDMDEAAQLSLADQVSPWDGSCVWGGGEQGAASAADEAEGWAQFGSGVCLPPVDPFASQSTWPDNENSEDVDIAQLQIQMQNMNAKFGDVAELTNNLLSAMSCMAPDDLATIVSDNAARLPLTINSDALAVPRIPTPPPVSTTPAPLPISTSSSVSPPASASAVVATKSDDTPIAFVSPAAVATPAIPPEVATTPATVIFEKDSLNAVWNVVGEDVVISNENSGNDGAVRDNASASCGVDSICAQSPSITPSSSDTPSARDSPCTVQSGPSDRNDETSDGAPAS